jgi:hypothetical protein
VQLKETYWPNRVKPRCAPLLAVPGQSFYGYFSSAVASISVHTELYLPVQQHNPDWINSVTKSPIFWSNAGPQLHMFLLGNSSSVTEFGRALTFTHTYLHFLTFTHLGSNIAPSNFPAGARDFSLLHSGVKLASYPIGTGRFLPGDKATGAWNWPLTSI